MKAHDLAERLLESENKNISISLDPNDQDPSVRYFADDIFEVLEDETEIILCVNGEKNE